MASAVALTLTQYDAGETPGAIAARLRQIGVDDPDLARSLYVSGAASTGRIVYPQLGGLRPDTASVMTVIEQTLSTAEGVTTVSRTLDIRLRRIAGVWRFDTLASTGGEPPANPVPLSPAAIAVLDDTRIALPDSARWDIHAGAVSERLLSVMLRLADFAPYGVITLVTGHPWEIFGTDRQSDHSRGLALDVYRLSDRLVIEDRASGSLTHEAVRWLYSQPDIARIGSPWALDGFGGRSFTDALHQDHLHIAVIAD
ncbi:hypothetical protein EMQ25_13910 [Arsenicitalea aurantiaca]|uniref:Uncharacterized protein n=1 Tax=Arsenicitalea aurantiaca TaxID=1783274 RepID=A0A433X8H1_9HYPH|nr:hypothetical protein [Arsenicitalea aurantiaca]RUT30397.1 hypothetical protein EMQ25_13910 [Arsenicitalea aurantiaca]